mmetsp:Transcript_34875/g.65109  ORF Transcript_34875/g.65109 Transcript_34875/m.65109 type:complete len:210 (+) Transcript_34875:77-706(+)
MPLSVNAPEFVPGFLAAAPRAANDSSDALGDQLIEQLAEAMRPQAPRSWFRILPSDGLFCPRCVAGDGSCEFHKPGPLKVLPMRQEPANAALEIESASRQQRSRGLPAPPTGPAPLPPKEEVECESRLLKDASAADFANSLSWDKIGDEHDDASTDVGSADTMFEADVSETASQHTAPCTRPRKSRNKITAEPSQNHMSSNAGWACHAR